MFKLIDSTLNEIITLELEEATDSFILALHSLFDMVRGLSVNIPLMTSVFQRYVVSVRLCSRTRKANSAVGTTCDSLA